MSLRIFTATAMLLLFTPAVAEKLIVIASIVDGKISTYADPSLEECTADSRCIQMSYWREYKAENVKVVSGDFTGKYIDFLMSSHTNWYSEDSKLTAIFMLEISGVKTPKYKVIDWSPKINVACMKTPIDEERVFAFGNEKGSRYCYDFDALDRANQISNKRSQSD
jgi:hypothetical protein